MGRPFLEHMGGKLFYSCQQCNTYLSSKKEVLADTFQGNLIFFYIKIKITSIFNYVKFFFKF